jgi:NADPH2:quinone reductase
LSRNSNFEYAFVNVFQLGQTPILCQFADSELNEKLGTYMMRAAYYEKLGAASDTLRIGNVDTPEPGPGEVRLRIHTSGVNPSDVKARQFGRGGGMPYPLIIPQSDGAGVIDAVGDGIASGRIGRRAWVMNGQYGRPFGTSAEYIVMPEKYVIDLPDGPDFAEAACFGIPFLTAWRAVTMFGDVSGKDILIQGGAGAVAQHAIQVAKRKGARVLTSISSQEKAEYAKAAGADIALNYRDDDFAAQVLNETGGKGADLIVEVNVSGNSPTYADILAERGKVVIYGTSDAMAQVPGMAFIRKGATLKWFIVYEISDEERDQGVAELNAMLSEGALETKIAKRFSLDETIAAHEAVEKAAYIGNIVVEVD